MTPEEREKACIEASRVIDFNAAAKRLESRTSMPVRLVRRFTRALRRAASGIASYLRWRPPQRALNTVGIARDRRVERTDRRRRRV